MKFSNRCLDKKSTAIIQSWIDELDVTVEIKKPRSSKLGDFKVKEDRFFVSINNNLNRYSFLITLTHELAHAFVYKKHKNNVAPHGIEWRLTFKSMLLNFMSPDYFPQDILQVLSLYIKKPKASTLTDIDLSRVLKTYNKEQSLCVLDIKEGNKFRINTGRIFIKGKKLRKRFKCIEDQTNKIYLFHPLTEISFVQ